MYLARSMSLSISEPAELKYSLAALNTKSHDTSYGRWKLNDFKLETRCGELVNPVVCLFGICFDDGFWAGTRVNT